MIEIGNIRKFGNIEFLAKQLVEGFITGLHKSPYHGFSVEFAEHRLYNSGESTRHIDWKAYGRTDRLYTKRYEEETNLRCQIILDNSSSMYYPEKGFGKITFGIMASAAISYMLQKQRDAVGIATFSEEIEFSSPIKSTPGHIHSLMLKLENLLNEVPKSKKTAVTKVLHQLADNIHKRSLVIIFSDMFENMENADSIFSALQHMKHNNHEVLLFHVFDSVTEKHFDFKDKPHIFTDVESGEKVKVQPSQVRDHYINSINQYFEELKVKAGQYKIDFIEADINKGFDQVLQAYLVKRRKMK